VDYKINCAQHTVKIMAIETPSEVIQISLLTLAEEVSGSLRRHASYR
jgi:hypothetical protein